ncbi:hypothetical protein HZS_4988 [Henneguya salminicola]|nr:hypothetical protein HZS_4988 [Henneguya salminicola]
MLAKHGIQASYISTYNPSANGISERINSIINAVLKIFKGFKIEEVLNKVNMRLNHSYHRILNSSPFELKEKYSYLDPFGRETNKIEESIKRTLRNIKWEEKKQNKARDIS